MEKKDAVVCGANGFTAKKLLAFLVTKRQGLSLGITCRSDKKIEEALKYLEEKLPGAAGGPLKRIATHSLDIEDADKLAKVFSEYKVVVNCIGPYAQTGARVLSGALKAKVHYLDFSGEPAFIEASFAKFDLAMKEAGVCAVHACGFDSLPLDVGMVYGAAEVKKLGEYSALEAESHLQLLDCRINLGTLRTAINSLDIRQSGRKQPGKKERPGGGRRIRRLPFFSPRTFKYTVIFPGSDSFVLRKTRALTDLPLPVCFCYLSVGSLPNLLALLLFVLLMLAISAVRPLRSLAYKYIDVLTLGRVRRGGPSDEEIERSRFATKIFITGTRTEHASCAQGMPGLSRIDVEVEVAGPDPGYVTTPACLGVALDLLLLKAEGASAPKGVFTPGALFHDTDIVSRLAKEGVEIKLSSVRYYRE